MPEHPSWMLELYHSSLGYQMFLLFSLFRPFKCEFCGSEYYRKNALKSHQEKCQAKIDTKQKDSSKNRQAQLGDSQRYSNTASEELNADKGTLQRIHYHNE